VLEDLKARLKLEEGVIPWMYRDSVGNVTVGVGHLLASSGVAAALPFALESGTLVGADEIRAEYARVLALEADELPSYYWRHTRLRLSQAAIDCLLDADVMAMQTAIARTFAAWADFPGAAREALLDMAFQFGVRGLVRGFPRLCVAASEADWKSCALECHVAGIGEARNLARAALFQAAVQG
jgi:GH24 family phage-related lysozyme (muramidase)